MDVNNKLSFVTIRYVQKRRDYFLDVSFRGTITLSIVKLQDSSLSLRGKCEFVCIKTREMGLNVGDEFRKRRGI